MVPMGAPVVLLMALSRLSRLSRCVPAAGFVDFNLHNRILEAHKSLETHEDADAPSACYSCRYEHLCTYALRRVLTVDDRDDLKAIQEQAKKNQYGVRSIVRAVALSDLIQKR